MYVPLPTELFLADRPASSEAIEHVCAVAAREAQRGAVAVAVAHPHVSRAANLLFGTGVGVVSSLDSDDPSDLVPLARLSVATGATEVALPRMVLDDAATFSRLKSFLGESTPVTVDVTPPSGSLDLAQAEYALLLGADYIAFAPDSGSMNPTGQTANLLSLAGELRLGGVKVASTSDHQLTALRSSQWAMSPGNARRCLAVSPANDDLRP